MSYGPAPTCPECESENLDDFDMAEDEDCDRRWLVFRCLDCGFPGRDLTTPYWQPSAIGSASEAREVAINWQSWMSEQNLSMGEMAEWGAFFAALAARFPELADEYTENGIISPDALTERTL